MAVDESTGNIFVSTDNAISVINAEKDTTRIVDDAFLQGTVGKITLEPSTGYV